MDFTTIRESKPAINNPSNKEIIEYSYYQYDNLKEIEEGIQKASISLYKVNLSLCLAFANISKKKLYKEYGYEDMTDYLKKQPYISYSLASDYRYIGLNYLRLKDDLERIDFNENDGLYKLKNLPKNKELYNQSDFFKHLKEDSSKKFREYISSLKKKNKLFITSKSYKKKKNTINIEDIEDQVLNELYSSNIINKEIEKMKKYIRIIDSHNFYYEIQGIMQLSTDMFKKILKQNKNIIKF